MGNVMGLWVSIHRGLHRSQHTTHTHNIIVVAWLEHFISSAAEI